MKKALIVGVMGGADVSPEMEKAAYELGRRIALEGWVLLNGGRGAGIMEASAKGAAENGGVTIGILPGDSADSASRFIRIPIVTGMGNARNVINVLSSHIVVACPGGAGTVSEVALALKSGKTVILLNFELGNMFASYRAAGQLLSVGAPEDVVQVVKDLHFRPET